MADLQIDPTTSISTIIPDKKHLSLDQEKSSVIALALQETSQLKRDLEAKLDEQLNTIPVQKFASTIDLFVRLTRGEITKEEFINLINVKETEIQATEWIQLFEYETRLEALKQEYLPYKREEAVLALQNLSKRLNHRKAIFYYEKIANLEDNPNGGVSINEMLSTLDRFAKLRSYEAEIVTSQLENKSFEELEYIIEEFAQRFEQEWDEKGFLEQCDDTPYQFNAREENPDDFATIAQKELDLLKHFSELKTAFRVHYRGIHTDFFLHHLQSTIRDYPNMDPRLMRAVAHGVDRRIATLLNFGLIPLARETLSAMAMEENLENAINQVVIEGLEVVEDKELAITEADLRQILEESVPAKFLKNIKLAIAKTPAPPEPPSTDEEDSKWETIGQHIEDMDKFGNLRSSVLEIYRSPYVEIGANNWEILLSYNIIKEITLHEAAHSIHYELALEDMEEWIEIMKSDPVYVSAYVEHTRKKNPNHYVIEDFAESYQKLFCSPNHLYKVSPKRFEFMINLLERYMSPHQFSMAKDHIRKSMFAESIF